MPYIKPEDRDRVADGLGFPETPGELNFMVTTLALHYWSKSPRNYQALNDIVGAIEGSKLELYRRLVAPYENAKIRDNGDLPFPAELGNS